MSKKEEITLQKSISPNDFDWFMQSRFFDALPQEVKYNLLNAMTPKKVPEGERLIRQGDEGDHFSIIRRGRCFVSVERDGVTHAIGRLGAGDIVGEMAILTGEKRNANVDAETDMEVWTISRETFDKTCTKFPELKQFLTGIVGARLSRSLWISERTIGKYVVEDTIGYGGVSVVYKGYHSTLGMPVTVKMLKHSMAMNSAFVSQFRNEAKTIAQLNHDNIVKVYDVEELYRTFFIIMEYVEGESLREILEKTGKPPLRDMVNTLLQICSGLHHAHEKGVIHRDVKPGNMLIQKDKKVKIVDFGTACAPGMQTENITGTACYVSPEQVQAERVDERTDIYSLGMTAYEMFTGQRPCQGDTIREMCSWHLNNEAPDPRSLVPDLPDELRNFMIRATRRDPSQRYPDVARIIYELEPLAVRMGLETKLGAPQELNMMSLFLFYREDQRLIMQKLVGDFRRELEKIGARLRGADFKNVEQ